MGCEVRVTSYGLRIGVFWSETRGVIPPRLVRWMRGLLSAGSVVAELAGWLADWVAEWLVGELVAGLSRWLGRLAGWVSWLHVKMPSVMRYEETSLEGRQQMYIL